LPSCRRTRPRLHCLGTGRTEGTTIGTKKVYKVEDGGKLKGLELTGSSAVLLVKLRAK